MFFVFAIFVVRCISRFACFNQCDTKYGLVTTLVWLSVGCTTSIHFSRWCLDFFFQLNLCSFLKRSITKYPWSPSCRWWWMGRWCWGRHVAVERFMDERLVSEEMRLQNGKVDVWLIWLGFYTELLVGFTTFTGQTGCQRLSQVLTNEF